MNVASPRALVLSLAIGLLGSILLGSIYAWLAHKVWAYGVGTVMFIVGLIVLVIGLLGAAEPKDGWASGRKKREGGRRSMAATVTREHPELEEASPIQLGVWGLIVGLPLIGLSLLAFAVAA